MNLLYSLPSDIKQIIYEYDPTYNEKFNKIINLLPEMVSNFRLKNVEINKRGWSTVNAICKLRDPSVYKVYLIVSIFIYAAMICLTLNMLKKLNILWW